MRIDIASVDRMMKTVQPRKMKKQPRVVRDLHEVPRLRHHRSGQRRRQTILGNTDEYTLNNKVVF